MNRPIDPVQARLEQVLISYGARLQRLLRTYGLDRRGIDPADVEQEVRIRLWKAIESDRFGAFGASYIQRVVATTVIDSLRRAEVRATEALPEEEDTNAQPLPDEGVGPEQIAGDSEKMAGLERCLAEIPERRRLPIELRLQGFALQEIADLTNTSVEAARKLVSRGMDELRTRLRECGYGDFED